jgi:hypothetical protein
MGGYPKQLTGVSGVHMLCAINIFLKDKMKCIGVVLIWLASLNFCDGQVTNSVIADKSNIYYHSLDTVFRLIKHYVGNDKVIVYGDNVTMMKIPDTIGSQPLIRIDKTKERRLKPKKAERWILVYLDDMAVEQGIFSIRIRTFRQTKKSMGLFADTLYIT